jgi:3-oxoacyl-[acyl-carrier protein] reductase
LQAVAATAPERISYVVLDVGDWAAHEAAIGTVIERHGRLDILINNAAHSVNKPFLEHTAEDFQRVIHVNLTSVAVLTQKATRFIAAHEGNIINVSSAAGKYTGMPPQMLAAYSASKAGLNQLTRILATELGPFGIRVNAVSPGVTDTEICAGVFADQALIDRCIAATPLGRTAVPDDIAEVICYLASEQAGWVTGQIVDATGGYHLAL